ncbi:MAG TPA: DUF4011 domain-containing protein [Gemmatimonadaceae bacterium]|nr:DUF4011 domain-containing protein [Gemmatimonadaceae bacterium]
MESPERDEAPRQLLERMRLRLLDLSARNPLLAYAHPRASSLRIVDEIPTLVLEALIAGRALRFNPLKSPNAPAPIAEPAPNGFVRRRNGRSGNGRSASGEKNGSDARAVAEAGERQSADPSTEPALSAVEGLGMTASADPSTEPALSAVEGLGMTAGAETERDRREAARAARLAREEQIRELAKELGIDPSYDLRPADDSDATRHGDSRLQTLLTPDELEARLQKLQSSAVTAIQESGANMLHLMFGFVEWADVPGERTRMAPLVLLPVNLARLALDSVTHTFPYTIAASGEDWSTNVTLQEMCRKSVGFALPSVEAEEGLEDYFARVEDVLRTAAPHWTLRRQLTLGLVSFGKILMWRDLDPATWPADRPLLDVPLLRQVLGRADDAGALAHDDDTGDARSMEYNIDALPAALRPVPPIVVSADSSQHSVLVDVQRGENLVVQGPPGTGKSQTITNLIADAIAAGKKVLFVAEKKAALDVVHARLADAGLGAYCLPLHSHTSNKREFLDMLAERIRIRPGDSVVAELSTVEGLLAETRRELTGHAERLNRPFGSLGLTAFDVLWRARRLGGEMPAEVVAALRGVTLPNARMVTQSEAAKHRATLQAFAAAHAAVEADVDDGETHPWQGMSRAELSFDDAQALVALAREARTALAAAESARQELVSTVSGVSWPDSPEALAPLLGRVSRVIPPDASVPGALIEATYRRAGESATVAAVAAADAGRAAWGEVEGPWGQPGAIAPDDADDLARRLRDAMRMLGDHVTVATVKEAVGLLSDVLDHLTTIQAMATRIATSLGVKQELPVGLALSLIGVATALEGLPEGALQLRGPGLQGADAAERLAAMSDRAAALSRTRALLDAKFVPEMRPVPSGLRQIASALAAAPRFMPAVFSGEYRRAVAEYRAMSGGRRVERSRMLADVEALLRYHGDYEEFVADPELRTLFGTGKGGLASPFFAATALLAWTRRATTAFRGTDPASRALLAAVWSASPAQWRDASELALTNAEGRHAATVLGEDLTAVVRFKPGDIALWEPLSFTVVEDQLHRWRDVALGGVRAATSAGASEGDTLASLADRLLRLRRAWAADATIESHAETFRALDIGVPARIGKDGADALQPVRGALAYLAQFHERGLPRTLVEWLASGEPRSRVATILKLVASVMHAIDAAVAAESKFSAAGVIDTRAWYGEWPKGAAFPLRITRFDRAIEGSGTLARYAARLRARAMVLAGAVPPAVELLESGAVAGDRLPAVYDYLLARTLAEMALRDRPELDRFAGSVHETRRAQFAALDERYVALTRQLIAQRANATPHVRGVGYGPVAELSEQSLIEHEIEKSRRHVPIREMFRRAGRAIQALKPCIMMGPQAVAQYLPPGLFKFDLVVMDEASQMRPEDALGAIARGAQLVVVGDPKQLGPTSFFETVTGDDEEIEETAAMLAASAAQRELPQSASVLERSESILQAAARRYPLRMLRWHYRSRYPELIAFGNREFYGGALVLFPHPGTEREGDGINFRPVDDAVYASSLNPREAERLVEAVRKHAVETPERTLMVVTMNQPQRELVDTLLQNAEKDDAALAAFRERHAETLEPLAVKNLENVQGDERDVVLVGVTYGPDERGRVAQLFGPINAIGGERRLNVLFTRAKYRLDVFCSFDPSVLRVAETSARGLVVLRDYLRFAKETSIATEPAAAREPETDFELEVARALRAHGYDVRPRVGVAGYHLDLAVVDPKRPGSYVLGIECDGPAYNAAKSARDRDRLRQHVLEQLGWRIHRVWTMDWFRDPRGESARIVRRIESLQRGDRREVERPALADVEVPLGPVDSRIPAERRERGDGQPEERV